MLCQCYIQVLRGSALFREGVCDCGGMFCMLMCCWDVLFGCAVMCCDMLGCAVVPVGSHHFSIFG